jgi:hypothetical protein
MYAMVANGSTVALACIHGGSIKTVDRCKYFHAFSCQFDGNDCRDKTGTEFNGADEETHASFIAMLFNTIGWSIERHGYCFTPVNDDTTDALRLLLMSGKIRACWIDEEMDLVTYGIKLSCTNNDGTYIILRRDVKAVSFPFKKVPKLEPVDLKPGFEGMWCHQLVIKALIDMGSKNFKAIHGTVDFTI